MSSEPHTAGGAHIRSPISVVYVVAAALLIGAGLTCAILWLAYFDWWFFLGFGALAVGAVMLFSRRAGFDSAEDPAFA